MRLREAIAKVSKWAWRGKQRSPTKCVRFLPSNNGSRCGVYATNGPQGLLVFLDEGIQVPNAMVDAEKLQAAIKNVREVTVDAQANETIVLSGVRLEGQNVNEFPAIPVLPEQQFQAIPDWWAIEKIVHAASKDPHQPLLRCLHFRHDLVEATDRFRVARVFVRTPWEALVPSPIFSQWPTGDVSAAFSEDLAVFRVNDEELRFTILKRGKFQDCDELLPARHRGPMIIVNTGEALKMIKRVKALGTACRFVVTGSALTIEVPGFQDNLKIQDCHGLSDIQLQVNSEWFCEALRQVSTPRVALGYTAPGEPLRIDSGAFSVGLWPFTPTGVGG